MQHKQHDLREVEVESIREATLEVKDRGRGDETSATPRERDSRKKGV